MRNPILIPACQPAQSRKYPFDCAGAFTQAGGGLTNIMTNTATILAAFDHEIESLQRSKAWVCQQQAAFDAMPPCSILTGSGYPWIMISALPEHHRKIALSLGEAWMVRGKNWELNPVDRFKVELVRAVEELGGKEIYVDLKNPT